MHFLKGIVCHKVNIEMRKISIWGLFVSLFGVFLLSSCGSEEPKREESKQEKIQKPIEQEKSFVGNKYLHIGGNQYVKYVRLLNFVSKRELSFEILDESLSSNVEVEEVPKLYFDYHYDKASHKVVIDKLRPYKGDDPSLRDVYERRGNEYVNFLKKLDYDSKADVLTLNILAIKETRVFNKLNDENEVPRKEWKANFIGKTYSIEEDPNSELKREFITLKFISNNRLVLRIRSLLWGTELNKSEKSPFLKLLDLHYNYKFDPKTNCVEITDITKFEGKSKIHASWELQYRHSLRLLKFDNKQEYISLIGKSIFKKETFVYKLKIRTAKELAERQSREDKIRKETREAGKWFFGKVFENKSRAEMTKITFKDNLYCDIYNVLYDLNGNVRVVLNDYEDTIFRYEDGKIIIARNRNGRLTAGETYLHIPKEYILRTFEFNEEEKTLNAGWGYIIDLKE